MLIMSKTFRCISVLACSNRWARQHFVSKNKPLATMSTNFPASSLTLNQSSPNPSAAFTRQGTSNRQPKHLTRSFATDSGDPPKEMDDALYYYFPTNLKKGSKTEARNGKIYGERQYGVKYIDIYTGDGEKVKKDDKLDIKYEVYDTEGEYKSRRHEKKFALVNLETGLQEGIEGMRSGGRRIITIPPNLASLFVEKGEYAIYDMAIGEIHSG